MQRLLRAQSFWIGLFILWMATLFTLSSFSKTLPDGTPQIPHLDKVLHFGYFLGGGFILGTWVLLRKSFPRKPFLRSAFPFVILAIIGALDEYHQTFTPGRSGNDPFDWLADISGAAIGLFIANLVYPLLLKYSSSVTEVLEI